MRRENSYIGIIEDIVREAKLVDVPRRRFAVLANNRPTTSLPFERRRFLTIAASAVASGFLIGCRTTGASNQGETTPSVVGPTNKLINPRWQEFLLSQDLVFGPGLLRGGQSGTFAFSDHEEHLSRGSGGVDYDVPKGIPLVSVGPRPSTVWFREGWAGPQGRRSLGFSLRWRRADGRRFACTYGHVDGYSTEGEQYFKAKMFMPSVRKSTLLGYSGDSGLFYSSPHLHFDIITRDSSEDKWSKAKLDPFEHGIDGGVPVYWDGKSEVPSVLTFQDRRNVWLNARTLTSSKSADELNLTDESKRELAAILSLGRRPDRFVKFQEFLRREVLHKHPDESGRLNYHHPPGTFLYALALRSVRNERPGKFRDPQLVITSPFISPMVAGAYEEANYELTLPTSPEG